MGSGQDTLTVKQDFESIYSSSCRSLPEDKTAIFIGSQRLEGASELFYAPVLVSNKTILKGMLDSGSMACTLSEEAEGKLKAAGVLPSPQLAPSNVVLVGCGGLTTQPKCIYDLEIEVYESKFNVPTLVIPGQRDEFIIGTNVIKSVLQKMKSNEKYWELISSRNSDPDCEQFLELLSCVSRWKGPDSSGKIGTVRLKQAVTLLPKREHLVWGKLPSSVHVSPGSTVIVEPTSARSTPRNILVGRVITPMWGDRWVPMKVVNPSPSPITLRRNTKLADVSPCLAVEDLNIIQGLCQRQFHVPDSPNVIQGSQGPSSDPIQALRDVGLGDIDVGLCGVSPEWKAKLATLLLEYQDIFSKGKLDCGEAKDFVHRIHLSDDRPFRLPYRRVPPADYQKLRQVLTDMEGKGIISKSVSEYASPLVMVWKRDGDMRICTDFRWLNAKTVKDAHPLPHQGDCLAALGGNAFFSTMDLTSGFYNVPLHESDRRFTAFTTPLGLYEYNRLPQGLCNSPASFMRMMLSIFGDLNFSSLLCYLDDLLVFAPSEEEGLRRLEDVFSRLRANNLKLAQKKCHFLRTSVKFLGHVVDSSGVSVDQEKIRVISAFNKEDLMESDGCTPSQRRVRSFLGMVLYYQHFIPGCSSIAKPLFSLTAGPRRKGRASKSRGRGGTFRELAPQDWTPACDSAFSALKKALINCVVLAHPNFDKPFLLSIDASLDGLGAVLSQVQDGEVKARPVAFASKSLSRSQANYPAHRLEFLALKWSVCDKFSHWLKGHSFTVWTDNNPLTYIMTKPKLDACEQRWVAKLAPYNFKIKHIPGRLNTVADALSRDPFVKPLSQRLLSEPYRELLESACDVEDGFIQDVFRLTCQPQVLDEFVTGSEVSLSEDEVSTLLHSHEDWDSASRLRAASLAEHIPQFASAGQDVLPVMSLDDLQMHQQQDAAISGVIPYVDRRRRPSRRERYKENHLTLKLLKHWDKLALLNGILYRVSKDPLTKHKRFQYVLPEALKGEALAGVHDLAGHQGQSRTLHLVRQRFFWHDMEKDIRNYVRNCHRCVLSKTPEPAARAPLESIKTTAPLELVCIDFWSAEDSNNKSVDVLVVTDHFTKVAHAFPCQDQTAKRVAKKLWDNFFCIYGFPERLHSDQGANFESELIAELLQLAGVTKSRTSPYHPMGNGGTERFNRTLGNMLRSLPPSAKQKWPQMIQTITFVYNCTAHETTGFAPFYLMFGRVPRLPVDLMFKNVLLDKAVCDYDSYVTSLVSDLASAMSLAQKNSVAEQKHQSDQYNKRAKGLSLSIGDQVLIANKGCRGKRKLADRWEPGVYTVVASKPSLHIYRIQDRDGKERVVHRNLLLQVNFLPLDVTQDGYPGSGRFSVGAAGAASQAESAGLDPSSTVAEPTLDRALDDAPSTLNEEDDDRTSSWVLDQTAYADGEVSVNHDVYVDHVDSHDSPGRQSEPPSFEGLPMGTDNAGVGASTLLTSVPHDTATPRSHDHTHHTDTHYTSRFGRFIRPVCRLIESMVQLDTVLGIDGAESPVIHV